MQEFPLFTAITRGVCQVGRHPPMLLGVLIVAEVLPLLFGPPALDLFRVNNRQEVFTQWLHPWACSQAAILGFACVALPGRWHVRLGLALLGVVWIWGSYMTGIQTSLWWRNPSVESVSGLARQLLWMFGCSALIASLFLSIGGLELSWEPARPRTNEPRRGQFSLMFLLAAMFATSLTLLALRAAAATPMRWIEPAAILQQSTREVLLLSVLGALASVAMIAQVSSRGGWIWLVGAIVLAFAAFGLNFGFQPVLNNRWWLSVVMVGHSCLIARLLPRLGVQLPRLARLEALERVVALVR
jgi:hypothetical protein